MMEWKPIESAPRDGTPVLIAGGKFIYDAVYGREYAADGVVIATFQPKSHRNGFEWNGGFGPEYDAEYWHMPTHWMPLPKPPVHSTTETD